jgi:acetoin utilization protein AcuC
MTQTDKLYVAYSDDYLYWNLGGGDGNHPTRPVRAKYATEHLLNELGDSVEIVAPVVKKQDRKYLSTIHTRKHIDDTIDRGLSYEWAGVHKVNGYTALQMFSGTARLVEKLIAGEIQVGFNPQGAKHHAQADWSEGFCVFNDFAWAAKELTKAGLKVIYIDWDVNAGDGVQNLLEETDIPTFSIHGHGIYPTHSNTWDKALAGTDATYTYHNEDKHWYNWCLERGAGDKEFAWAMDEIAEIVSQYQPDVILLATGADGHEGEHWGLKYTYDGYHYAAHKVAELANKYADGRVLIGGAGGYQPHTHTPRIWANVVEDIYLGTRK